MFSSRFFMALTFCLVVVAAQNAPLTVDADYLDDIKEYGQHNVDDVSHKYMEQINKMDMLDVDDYPEDEDDDFDDEDDEDDDDEDDEDEDDDDDEEGGGCGGGDDDDDDEDDDEEDLNPVQEVIEEFFTR